NLVLIDVQFYAISLVWVDVDVIACHLVLIGVSFTTMCRHCHY
ncbi:11341_t:CDS:2, partial [Dentiscutata heterogama]